LTWSLLHNIQVHPLALIHYDLLENESVKAKIAEMTALYEDKPQYFVEKLAHGVDDRCCLLPQSGGYPHE